MTLFLTCLYLLTAGIIAGILSTVAGLASLVSYPVLLSIGVPPVSADVTNTAALIFTGIGSTMSSQLELRQHRHTMWHVSLVTVAGGILGCLILAFAPSASFEHVVPFLILLAAIMMTVSGRHPEQSKQPRTGLVWQIIQNMAIFCVGIYIGYFGAAAGIFMLAVLTVTLDKPFIVSNAIKNFASFLTNTLSLVIYAFTTKVYWLLAIPLALGMFIGGYVGPIVARHMPIRLLRRLISLAAFGLAFYLFWDTYF